MKIKCRNPSDILSKDTLYLPIVFKRSNLYSLESYKSLFRFRYFSKDNSKLFFISNYFCDRTKW